jgi:NitT/TauT family transport system ATP-binding protein
VFVTHSIEEAILLSDRVLVMRGGTLCGEFSVPFARPRDESEKYSNRFNELKREILSVM